MPAAAVVPAPMACIGVVAVERLVVELMAVGKRGFGQLIRSHPSANQVRTLLGGLGSRHFTLRELECFRQAMAECVGVE